MPKCRVQQRRVAVELRLTNHEFRVEGPRKPIQTYRKKTQILLLRLSHVKERNTNKFCHLL